MADITQKLGFDASQAIETINLLNQALQSLNGILGNTGTAISNWNAIGGAATSQFTSMKNAADAARKSIEALTAAQTTAASNAAKANLSPNANVTPPPPPNLDAYVQAIQTMGQKLGQIPAQASEASRRSYASAVAGLAEFASKNKVSISDVEKAWANSGTVVTGAANTLANKCQAVKNAHKEMSDSIKKDSGVIGQAWSLMVRMAAFQVIHQAINGLINLFKQAVTEAVDFGKRLAEVGTIMGKPFTLTQDELNKTGNQLMKLSSMYGMDLADATKGYYETLSNQVGNASESMHVFESALRLAVSTNTSVTDSVNLLTAALNSYGMTAKDAENVSGVLFKAIELGRFQGKDLANILGRVAPIAHEVGVSFEEMMTSLTVMTITGTKADTAVTQLRGVMTQLLKPTNELKALFQEKWGVSNAQEAISLFGGLVPLLKALDQAADGNNSTLSTLFKNVRALTGAMQMGGEHTVQMAENLKKLQASGKELIDWATTFVLDSPAKKAEVAWKSLQVTMVRFAQDTLPTLASAVNILAAGLGAILNHFKSLMVFLGAGGIVGGLIALRTAGIALIPTITGLKAAFSSLYLSLGPVGIALLAATAAWAAYTAMTENTKFDFAAYEEASTKKAEAEVKFLMESQSRQERHRQDAVRGETQYLQAITSAYKLATSEISDEVQRSLKASQASLKSMMESITSTVESALSKIEGSAKKTMDIVAKAREAMADERLGFQGRSREVNRKFMSPVAQEEDLLREASAELRAGQAMVRSAHDTDQLEAATKRLTKAKELYAKVTSDASTKAKAEEGLRNEKRVSDALIEAKAREIQIAEQRDQKVQQYYPMLKASQTEILELTKKIEELYKPTTAGGKMKTPEQIEKDTEKAIEATIKLNQVLDTLPKAGSDLAKALGIDKEMARLQTLKNQLPPMVVKIIFDTGTALEQLQKLKMGMSDLQIEALKLNKNDISGSFASSITKVNKELETVQASLDKYDTRMLRVKVKGDEAAKAIDAVTASEMKRATQISSGVKLGLPIEKDAANYVKLVTLLKDLTKAEMDATERTNKLREARKLLSEEAAKITEGGLLRPGFKGLEQAAGILMIQEQIRKEREAEMQLDGLDKQKLLRRKAAAEEMRRIQLEAATQEQQRLLKSGAGQEALDKIQRKLDELKKKPGEIGDEVKNNMTQEIDAATSAVDELTSAWYRAAAAAASVQPPQMAATGGLIRHLAAGGPSGIGTDTVPAMLTPGEFVMNNRATSRFFSQLVAMNAGTTPQGRATGGPITNFGDINVNVGSGGGSRQIARDIGAALRRELRRGTSSLG